MTLDLIVQRSSPPRERALPCPRISTTAPHAVYGGGVPRSLTPWPTGHLITTVTPIVPYRLALANNTIFLRLYIVKSRASGFRNTTNSSMAKPNHESPRDGVTWEELLLAYAVNRFGTNKWDSISSELQKRTSDPIIFTPENCKQKYKELERRFNLSNGDDVDNTTAATAVPWIEQLRQLRVAELQKEVKTFDIYISSLQLKVKKLTGETEKRYDLGLKSDEIEIKNEEEVNNKPPDLVISGDEQVPGVDESDRDNQSMNGSNENLETGVEKPRSCDARPDAREPGKAEPDGEARQEPESRIEGIVRENSEVQSSASKTRKDRSDRVRRGCSKAEDRENEDLSRNGIPVESWPLIDILEKIHQLGSAVFDRRLDRQEKVRYKNLIKEHIDFNILQTRLKEGWYSNGNKFFRDMLLLVNNTCIFFPSKSPEFAAAIDLRQFILKTIKSNKIDSKSMVKQTSSNPTTLPPKQAPELAGPMTGCRKRSSTATKFLNRLNEGSSTSDNVAVGVAAGMMAGGDSENDRGGGGGEGKKDGHKRSSGGLQLKEPDSPAKRSVGRPPKKVAAQPSAATTLGKRNRGSAESESSVLRQRKER